MSLVGHMLGNVAYRAWCAVVVKMEIRPAILHWDDLPQEIRDAWVAAALAVQFACTDRPPR